jgi:tetratricopeptide (TPR) repeat protein/energy-coupling factor transporter ATP-binding protein EcfA2
MQTTPNEPTYSLSNADREELNKLVSVLELSDSTTTIFAIAPESGPQHPVVEELKSLLLESEENFQFQNFFYSDNSLHNFLYGLDEVERQTDEVRSPQPSSLKLRLKRGAMESDKGERRLVVMAFGIDQLPTPRLVREMKQLNLGRDSLFQRELVLIFWLNKVEFLDEFRNRAPDFWDWRGKVVQFEARPVFNPLFYPYLEWLIGENSYLKISGVMQVQRQVDIFLDQIYVSLQGVRRQQVTETSERGHRELEVMTSRHVGKGRRGGSALDEFELLDEFEPLVPDFVPDAVSTKTVTQKVDLSQAVRENQYCVILGAPGAGKTTLLRYLALHFGMAKRDGTEVVAGGEGQEELGKPLLPIFFRIADYAERLAQEPDLSLLEYLRQFYRQWEVYFKTRTEAITSPPDLDPPLPPFLKGEPERNAHPDLAPSLHSEGIPPQPPLLRGELELEDGVPFNSRGVEEADIPQLLCEQMRHGQCLMLLDGLDEVFDQESRRLIVERINQFVEMFSANKFVVTSRIAGYRDVKLSERFAGEVLAQVEINSRIRLKLIEKLVLTLVLGNDFEIETIKQLLRLLRQIELFNLKSEVIARLKQAVNDLTLSEEMRIKAQTAILYVACGETGAGLVDCATEIVKQLEPSLFCSIKDLVAELGGEMTPALETTRQNQSGEQESHRALTFLTAMSYIRTDNYGKAIDILEKINDCSGSSINAYIDWSLATCYQEKEEFDKAIDYYQKCFAKLAPYIEPSAFLLFWRNRGICHCLHGKYEQALDCFQKMLTITRKIHESREEATCLWHIGKIYKEWSKYEEAITHHQQSLDLYQQLGRDKNVANQWYWLSDCYKDWGKYEQAVECQQQCLRLRQQREDQSRVALSYYQLGRIYQAWGKYEEAIAHYQQSHDLYEQLGQDKDVASQWYNLADCYRDWGKYQQAVECVLKDLAIRQKLEDQTRIALVHLQLGLIYLMWGKYEQASTYYQQSRELYEQLGQEQNVAALWGCLTVCYREWGKYQQAEECELKVLAIRQQLDDQPNIARAYFQLGRIYQAWGKCEQAIAHYLQSRNLYEQLGQDKDVASRWYNLADCYRDWGKHQQALECQQQCLRIRQTLDDQSWVAVSYYQLGRIYQDWGKYEQAIAHYQQSRELYEQLGKEKDVANLWYWLGDGYRDWGKYEQALTYYQHSLDLYEQLDLQKNVANRLSNLANGYRDLKNYTKAIEYYQQSRDLHQQLGQDKSMARRCRQIANSQRLLAKNTPDTAEASNLLTQAEQNIRQAIQLNTAGDYKKRLAYDYTTLGLLWSERLRLLPADDPSLPEQIAQFEDYYNTGLTYLTELGQTIDRAEETLDMARAYLEINALENLDRAEALAQESLQIFQDYNRRKLEAVARKLLGEIYLKRAQRHQPNAEAIAHQFLSESLQLYRELDLTEKAAEVEQLMPPNSDNAEQK